MLLNQKMRCSYGQKERNTMSEWAIGDGDDQERTAYERE
jgi:hypothetical protein